MIYGYVWSRLDRLAWGHAGDADRLEVRAKDMAQIADRASLSREQLYRSLSSRGNLTLKRTIAVMQALGIELTAKIPA